MNKILILILLILLLMCSGCKYRLVEAELMDKRDSIVAKQLANISVTAQAQLHETPPPIAQTANAIKRAADAALKVLDYEIKGSDD